MARCGWLSRAGLWRVRPWRCIPDFALLPGKRALPSPLQPLLVEQGIWRRSSDDHSLWTDVVRLVRTPVIGSALLTRPPRRWRILCRLASPHPFVNLSGQKVPEPFDLVGREHLPLHAPANRTGPPWRWRGPDSQPDGEQPRQPTASVLAAWSLWFHAAPNHSADMSRTQGTITERVHASRRKPLKTSAKGTAREGAREGVSLMICQPADACERPFPVIYEPLGSERTTAWSQRGTSNV